MRRLSRADAAPPPESILKVVDAAQRYFRGEMIDFSDVELDLGPKPEFFRQCYAAARRVRWRQTTTYGALAKQLGGGSEMARDVGQAMAGNPIPLIIPCHRVLAAGGKLGGFSAPGGVQAKLRMLALEGFRAPTPPPEQQSIAF
jgi:methylated-DNA-[protein]-cysteine S-methyltransferase